MEVSKLTWLVVGTHRVGWGLRSVWQGTLGCIWMVTDLGTEWSSLASVSPGSTCPFLILPFWNPGEGCSSRQVEGLALSGEGTFSPWDRSGYPHWNAYVNLVSSDMCPHPLPCSNPVAINGQGAHFPWPHPKTRALSSQSLTWLKYLYLLGLFFCYCDGICHFQQLRKIQNLFLSVGNTTVR